MAYQKAAVALVALLVAPVLAAQSLSGIGKHLDPWGTINSASLATMTTDGEWIYFVDAKGLLETCSFGTHNQRIARIHPDGTGYEVLLTGLQLLVLAPGPSQHLAKIKHLRVSGDGRWLAFFLLVIDSWCGTYPPGHWYILNVETGEANELLHNGLPIGIPSFTDDGSTMAFRGYDTETDAWWFHLANPDGTGAVKVLDTSPFGNTSGMMISPDGSKLLFDTFENPCPCPGDVFIYDLASQKLTQLNDQPGVGAYACTYDGSKIVFATPTGLYGILADGSQRHLIAPAGSGGNAAITRGGKYVYYLRSDDEGIIPYEIVRTTWEGSEDVVIDGFMFPGVNMLQIPTNADGSIAAVWTEVFADNWTLAVWHAETPVLTTYGYGTGDSTLYWDVGGSPGDVFTLEMRLRGLPFEAEALAPGLGPVTLADTLGLQLGSGTVQGPYNVGSLEQVLPLEVDLIGPLDVDFRATVMHPSGRGAPQVTNWTRMTLGAPSAVAPATAASQVTRRPPVPVDHPLLRSPFDRTPEEELAHRALFDPKLWWQIQRGEVELTGSR